MPEEFQVEPRQPEVLEFEADQVSYEYERVPALRGLSLRVQGG